MGSLTDTAENKLLDHIFGTASYTPSTPLKVALMTASGSDASAGTEVVGGSYARQSLTCGSASAGSASNSGTISFSGMPACTVVGVEVWDSSGTNRLWWGALAANKTVGSGDTVQFTAGQLTFSLD
jgi:hypothetical protein